MLLTLVAFLAASLPPLDLPPDARYAFLNVGTNVDPILPPADNSSVVAIGFEPIVHANIPPTQRLFIVPAAVSDTSGISVMRVFPKNKGQSSSLLAASGGLSSHVDTTAFERRFVPVVSMSSVLSGFPANVELWFLKTDMQGHDAKALVSAGRHLRRAHYIASETWMLNHYPYGDESTAAQNSYCDTLLPAMLKLGYVPVGVMSNSGISAEEIRELRDPKLHTDPSKGPYEGLNRFLFLHSPGGVVGATKANAASVAVTKAEALCSRQRAYLRKSHKGATPGLKEADAFFIRNDTHLPPPTVPRIDWPGSRAVLHALSRSTRSVRATREQRVRVGGGAAR